ncbi:uncharacterized protein LOC107882406 isoform X1 [Acyrthosiphon pisum]|uniref:Uncharacterized protein n=1 Tax=Acyrthosiphon pisum TaxID=7029 RepID=A0A8R2D251_ACYPI|nr:uncharacterized protein LOC107882406 isoform X1 [Acyrthosiphon pisum]|eukprot:XP_016656190.1 PREDICTED: uncharacterized protein LOC107882406 isoform X1 [Acyrthosiphon pisum]
MPSPRSFSASSLDDVHDYDLDGLGGCSFDIINEIDKFLEGLNGAEPVKTADLEVVNNNTPTKQIDVEFVGKDSAVFQLLEDHENYGVYEHNPNECNWNVFYKTLPPDEQKFIKVEPKTEIVNDYFNTDSENILETFSFNLDNTQEKQIIGEYSSNVISTAADISETSFYDDVLENFSFKISPSKVDNIKEKPIIGEHSSNVISTAADTSETSCYDDVLENFSFKIPPSKDDNIKVKPFIGEHFSTQSHLPPVRFRPHGVVREYLCPVSLAGTTIKFVSRKLANTSMREQILIELATHGVIENNWWTPDDNFYTTYTERTCAQNVFKIYPHSNKNSY